MKNTRHTEIGSRLRETRNDWYGEHGAQFFADALGIPLRIWLSYESGHRMTGDIMLRFLVMTQVNPEWLLSGQGVMCNRRPE